MVVIDGNIDSYQKDRSTRLKQMHANLVDNDGKMATKVTSGFLVLCRNDGWIFVQISKLLLIILYLVTKDGSRLSSRYGRGGSQLSSRYDGWFLTF